MDFIFNNGPNEHVFHNPKDNSEIIFVFREPTADERLKYDSSIAFLFREKEGKEMDEETFDSFQKIKLKFGLEVLKGFRVKDVPINISSDQGSETYVENWKELVAQRAPDLVIMLATKVFETGGFLPAKNS